MTIEEMLNDLIAKYGADSENVKRFLFYVEDGSYSMNAIELAYIFSDCVEFE